MIPAIDLKGGQCVRLRQGDMTDSTVFSDNPVAMAERWHAEGARRLHIVDLDGAFAGEPMNASIIEAISRALPSLQILIGVGIRDLDTFHDISMPVCSSPLSAPWRQKPGAGSRCLPALPRPDHCRDRRRGGRVAVEGWASESELDATDLAKQFADAGVSAVVYTDIERDGMMQGVNVDATVALAKRPGYPLLPRGYQRIGRCASAHAPRASRYLRRHHRPGDLRRHPRFSHGAGDG